MKQLKMPSFGADMATGIVAQWLVKPGDRVKKGDIVASIDTMKGLIDMEVFDDGLIEKLLVPIGIDIKVGQPIAELRLLNEPVSHMEYPVVGQQISIPKPLTGNQDDADTIELPATGHDVSKLDIPKVTAEKDKPGERRISPAARKKATDLSLDWRQVKEGSGPHGAVILEDIISLGKSSVAASETGGQDSAQQMRAAIAAVVSRSKREIPHYYLQMDMQLNNALTYLDKYNQGRKARERILPTALVYCAIARAVSTFPRFNGFYQQELYHPKEAVHLGNAISLHGGGLVVAAIHQAQQLTPQQMMAKLTDQVIRAREGGLRISEMQDATITVSNLGDRGTDSMQSIIFPPQVAIIALGRQRIVPWVTDQQVNIANIVTISLAADHRVSDGHSGARLLNKINRLLQNPSSLT